jgi:hypothetical protein
MLNADNFIYDCEGPTEEGWGLLEGVPRKLISSKGWSKGLSWFDDSINYFIQREQVNKSGEVFEQAKHLINGMQSCENLFAVLSFQRITHSWWNSSRECLKILYKDSE